MKTTILSLLIVLGSLASANDQVKNLALFHCAKELNKIVHAASPGSGQLFHRGEIVFSSTEVDRQESTSEARVKDKSQLRRPKRLLVFTETQSFEFPLPTSGIANLIINVPNADPRLRPKEYYIRYYHSNVTAKRVFNFNEDKPSFNSTELNYSRVEPVTADNNHSKQRLLTVVNHQLEEIIAQVKQGFMFADDLLLGNISKCKNILPEHQRLISLVNHKLDRLALLSPKRVRPKNFQIHKAISNRMPASVLSN